MSATTTTVRELFGGAITIELPSNLIDASTLRQVPDTQEVFLSPESDISFILEILQRAEPSDLNEAEARFHFDSIAHDNDATESKVISVDTTEDKPEVSVSDKGSLDNKSTHIDKTPITPTPILLHGSQTVAKFNRTTPDNVQILVSLYRIESKGVDLVFSANVPIKAEGNSGMTEEEMEAAKVKFTTAARSLRILDYGLFA